ncbi:MAG: GTP cyclohydrolase II RibA [Nanoarchaeota archaeon]|nr:GTP cyclohydrolase II RibA [Nanoarchaeota archaeon]
MAMCKQAIKQELGSIRITEKILDVPLKNHIGSFKVGAYSIFINGTKEDIMILYKSIEHKTVNLRINSACFSGDIFRDLRCDCNWQLQEAMKYIHENNNGLIIYFMNHDGRGAGIVNKLRTYILMDLGLTTFNAFKELGLNPDSRDYTSAAVILRDLGISSVNLLTNNPKKIQALVESGFHVKKRIPIVSQEESLQDYLLSKSNEMGHLVGEIK